MKRLLTAALVLAASGCGWSNFRGESWSKYYPQPQEETARRLADRRVILHWTNDPRAKEQVGYLERWEVTFAGARNPVDYWFILDRTGRDRVGFINTDGRVSRYRKDGTLEPVGEYPVIDLGLKVFLGYPSGDNLGLEEIDIYRQ